MNLDRYEFSFCEHKLYFELRTTYAVHSRSSFEESTQKLDFRGERDKYKLCTRRVNVKRIDRFELYSSCQLTVQTYYVHYEQK